MFYVYLNFQSPHRVALFHQLHPELALPPEPVITRWGTWLEAAIYYAQNLQAFSNVVSQFDNNEAASISHVLDVLESPALVPRLRFIATHYSILPTLLAQLETRDIALLTAIQRVNSFKEILSLSKGIIGEKVFVKFTSVCTNNTGWAVIEEISRLLEGSVGM